MARTSATALLDKLGVREGTRMAVVNAPADFRANLGELPLAVEWANRVRPPLDLVVAFHVKRAALVANWPALAKAVTADGAIWIAWPKKASGMATELTEDVVRDELAKAGWAGDKVCAIDGTWSGLRFVARRERRSTRPASTAAPAKLRKSRPGAHR